MSDEWSELPHALYVVLVCASHVLAAVVVVAMIGSFLYFVGYQLSRLL